MAGGGTRRRSMSEYSVATHAAGPNAGDARMERYHERVGRRRQERRVWPGAAFIVEALLLLVFLAGSLAVLMELNADAHEAGQQSAELVNALTLASNAAEEFAADPVGAALTPASSAGDGTEDASVVRAEGLVLVREVLPEAQEAGVLYRATITVWNEHDVADLGDTASEIAQGLELRDRATVPVYRLETAAYVPDASAADDTGALADAPGTSVVLDDPAAPPVVGLAPDATSDADAAAGDPADEGKEASHG